MSNIVYDICDFKKLKNKSKSKTKNKYKYKLNNKKIKYDKRTIEWYISLRKNNIDPLTHDYLDNNYYEFKYEWDPYTGEIRNEDPYGSLKFNPVHLAYYYDFNKLNNLWTHGNQEYQGYYGDGLGAGENFYINSRGNHPEWYLFRIPIIDCYLTEDNNQSNITMGAKLTFNDIKKINDLLLLEENVKLYKQTYNKNPIDLVKLYKLYHQAISTDLTLQENQKAVNEISTL
jgi:hypothetical protein